ncbi:breast carcinoma-amplified sequence 1 isoform X2 [Amblyraja radiata]|uniref:breast carcinoma-amplified sequence 1 isoform X2 n=1 Tax=Amblyraja radiata TaxID=386614 RepID=UPI001403FF56|nr:breast carcinoma-amplified sequence 1 isoform X2 [Amblyraja radiata]
MGNAESQEPLNDSETEPATLKQDKTGSSHEIIQNGPTQQNTLQSSVQDIWRFDYLMRKLHLKSRNGKDRGAEGEQDSEASTTRKTMVRSASTNAEEIELDKPTKPISKSIFSFSFARSVPGRTDDSSTEPKSETAQLQANQKTSGNTAPIDKMNLRQSSPQKGDSAQKQRLPSTESFNAAESTEKETGQPKQKEVSFFDKLFKQGDKSKQQNGHRGDLKTAGSQDLTAADREAGELIHRLDNVHQYLETGNGNKDHKASPNADNLSQNPASARSSEKDSEKENKAETPADDNSVMNFFKTLVTPTKSSSKTELDSHQAPDDKKVNGEHKEPTGKAHKSEQEALKAKDTDLSERQKSEKTPTQSPFGKLFKQKAVKEPQFEQENVACSPEVKTEKGMSQPQKQISKQGSKDSEAVQEVRSEEEAKPAKKGFLNFFKQTESGSTDDSVKKGPETEENSVQQPEKVNGNSKQKKSVPEGENRRTKSLEALPPTQQPNTTSEPIPNGSNNQTKETPEKRLEKRQSFGMFLKQLGGRKTADAAVQTDPVVIHPAGKTK